MAVTFKPWNGSASRFTDDEYRRSCLIKGPAPFKTNCHLPVREPDGTVNCNGVSAAKGALSGARGANMVASASVRSTLNSLSAQCDRARANK